MGSATIWQNSQRENLGVAGSIVCDSDGNNHNIERVYKAPQFQRLFHSLQRQFARASGESSLCEATRA